MVSTIIEWYIIIWRILLIKFHLHIRYFNYISGGFVSHIDRHIMDEVNVSGVHGSGITASNLIMRIENHTGNPYSHAELYEIFGLAGQIILSDIHHYKCI